MTRERMVEAVGRLERALSQLEAISPPVRDETLRREARETLAGLDTIIAELKHG